MTTGPHYAETKSDKDISVLYSALLKVILPFGADFLARETTPPARYPYVVTANLFPQAGIVLWSGSSYAGALFLPL
jgi:hypothetical protein